jgi:hypothetical protein
MASAEPASASVQELQEYSQLRERYLRTTNALASAAHDLKTPLAILNGYVELLQSEKLGGLNERQREVLRDMRSNGQRLQRYIQDFLSFSVLETGDLKMRFEPGNINSCLSEVCRLWSPRFQERGLAMYFLANEKVNEFAFDAPKVERIISNLLENASKFTPAGGTVWLHAEPYVWERRALSKASLPGTPPPAVATELGQDQRVHPGGNSPSITWDLRRLLPPARHAKSEGMDWERRRVAWCTAWKICGKRTRHRVPFSSLFR